MIKPEIVDAKSVNINDIKPKDRVDGYPLGVPRWYTRILEIFPGLITWALILLPFLAIPFGFEEVIVVYVSFLTIYWSFRGIRFAYGLIEGYRRTRKDLQTDWMAKIEELDTDIPKFIYICPMVSEGWDVLDPAFELFAKQEIGSERIAIAFALEEKYLDKSLPVVERLIEKYDDKFAEFKIYVHPHGIEGEVTGVKGANINWAARNYYKELVERGDDPKDYLLITCDSDSRPHPKYLSAITYKYLTSDKPMNRFFCTAVHTFNNNIWRVPALNRVFSHSLTLAIFHSWVIEPYLRETWSSYVVNFQTVHDVEYWDPTIGIDDTPFYWNARIRLGGDFKGEEVYIPTYNDAVENQTYYKSHVALYKQQLRWGWGIIVFPTTLASLYRNNDFNLWQKLMFFSKLFHNQLMFLTVIYTITFAIPILQIFSPDFQYSPASYNMNQIMRVILTGLMFLNIPVYLVRKRLSPYPEDFTARRKLYDFIEIILITVNMLTFGFIPKIHAQTLMLLNRFSKKHYATEKVKIEKRSKDDESN